MIDGIGIARKKLIDMIIKENFNVEEPTKKDYNYMELLYVIQEMTTEEGKKYFSKGLTKRGHTIFREFVKYLLYRNIANFDSMVLVTANKGLGKSSAAIMMAREWCNLLGIKFSPKRHIAYNNADLMEKLDTLKKFEPIICVSGDTEVNIIDMGGYHTVKIEDLYKRGRKDYKILSMNIETKELEYKDTNGCICNGVADIFEIELENGNKIKATKNHLFLTRGKLWKRLDELKEGESLFKNSKIKKISYIGKEKVYDIKNIKDNHNYIANNFVVHNCDESTRFMTAAEWGKKENKELKRKLAEVRTKHHLLIMCFPLKIQRIESNYLNSFVNYWIHLVGRGKGAIFVGDLNPANDPWRLKAFLKLGSYTEFTDVNKVEAIMKRHPNFWTTITFPKPPKWLYDSYLKVREKNVYDDDDLLKSVSNDDIVRALLILSLRDIVTNDGTLSMNRLILHIKNKYDVTLRKGMIFDSLEDSKQLIIKVQEKAIGIKSKPNDIVLAEKETSLEEDES